jgi:hypothetical protein
MDHIHTPPYASSPSRPPARPPSLPPFLPQVLSLLSRPRGELVLFREETLVEEALGGKMASVGSTGFLRQVGREGGREGRREGGKGGWFWL